MKLVNDFGIRALLAVLIVIPTMVVLALRTMQGDAAAMAGMTTSMAAATGWYFYQRRPK